jgi:tetratricopeptide (TPR) repeat protein
MSITVRSAFAALAAVGFSALPIMGASAQITVFGSGEAQACAQAARFASKGVAPDSHAVDSCNGALTYENLTLHDRAGTFINRGVLLMARQDYAASKQDFDAAVELMPEIGEAYTDRGAALVGLGRYAEAIVQIDKGLALNTGEPEKAYYNRALADEGLDDLTNAYRDYLRASQLKPDWNPPKDQLARFTVVAPGKS